MDKKHRLLILYTELAGYTLACLREFSRHYPGVEIHLVRWPVNSEAPFRFSFDAAVTVYERRSLNEEQLSELARKINPDAILCSGWIDKTYVKICREWNGKIPVILVMDNKWQGTWKQRLAKLMSPFTVLRSFSHAWVPGEEQKVYAKLLGFPEKNIRTGFYAADYELFHHYYEETAAEKKKNFPKRFVYAGRYYEFKGVKELWDAFRHASAETSGEWELWCLGTGDVVPLEHPSIRHFGFVQPSQLKEIMRETGVFILPSRVEPWGVVVHEFAAAGFPLLLSDKVGAASSFLRDGENGFSFPAGDAEAIREAMKKIMALPDEKLLRMGELSTELAAAVTPAKWAGTLYRLIHEEAK